MRLLLNEILNSRARDCLKENWLVHYALPLASDVHSRLRTSKWIFSHYYVGNFSTSSFHGRLHLEKERAYFFLSRQPSQYYILTFYNRLQLPCPFYRIFPYWRGQYNGNSRWEFFRLKSGKCQLIHHCVIHSRGCRVLHGNEPWWVSDTLINLFCYAFHDRATNIVCN